MLWGLIGGGKDSQIGNAHRTAARLDGLFTMAAAAVDIDPARGTEFAIKLGVPPDRAYGDWKEMIADEARKRGGERLDLVTVATPNNSHYEISRALVDAGLNVFCEKPLTMTEEEADDLVRAAENAGVVFGVNFGYSGYPMIIQAREMVRRGDLGDVRVVVTEFAHGFHADAEDLDNPRIRWRYDPAQAGVSSVVADLGTHVFHMAKYLTGQNITSISAHFDRLVPGRKLEDDANLSFRLDGGAVGRLWTSAIAIGQPHGFTVRIFGSKGALRWEQEFPNQLYFSPLNGATRIMERGQKGLYPKAEGASRIAIGHAEGMHEAFANIYRGLHDAIAHKTRKRGDEDPSNATFPDVREGADVVHLVHAAARSAAADGAWVHLEAR